VDIFGLRVAFLSLLIFAGLWQAEKAQGNALSIAPDTFAPSIFQSEILSQQNAGDCACGPCAIFNAFQFGNPSLHHLAATVPGNTPADKVSNLIKMYGGKRSVVSRNQPRFLANGGMWDEDLVPFINDWLKAGDAAPVKGERLTLQANETSQEHLRRVYDKLNHSLAAGFPPVVNLQSYAARKNFFHHYWKWMDGHFVTVVAVQGTLPDDASQFSMWVADSQTGRLLKVSVCADSGDSSTMAESRAKRSGSQWSHPTEEYPYLKIQSPKLETILEGNTAKTEQTICVLQYIAHR
jgi:hypothetical protein